MKDANIIIRVEMDLPTCLAAMWQQVVRTLLAINGRMLVANLN
jgi:hypothetical protein